MHTVLLAKQRWIPYFKLDKQVIFNDNATVYHGLCCHTVWGPAMDPLPKITHIAALHNINIHALYLHMHKNALANLLSRHNFPKLANQFPLLAPEQLAAIPQSHGTQTSAFPELQPATNGSTSAQIPDEHMKQLAPPT